MRQEGDPVPRKLPRPLHLPWAAGARLRLRSVDSSRLEAIVKHDRRLDVLCCLLDAGPLGIPQVAARTRAPDRMVHYWVRLLETFNLVEKVGDPDDREARYRITLDGQPDWVEETIEAHRRP